MPYLYALVVFISATIWLLPPVRQYKTKFFYFFLLLGLADALPWMVIRVFYFKILSYYLVVSCLLLFSLFDKETLKQKFLLVILLFITVIVIAYGFTNPGYHRLLFFVLHGLILLRITHLMGLELLRTRSLNLFFVVLVFYELLTLAKFFEILVKVADLSVLTNFYIVTGVQIAIGIFFTIFREDNRRLRVKLE